MDWYKGGIADAVALSKSRGVPFVVYIEGTDDRSKAMTAALNQPEISSRLGNVNKFISINVKSDSEAYKQFAQIYLMVPVPSLFFIKPESGVPEEIICGDKESLSISILQTIDKLERKNAATPDDSLPGTSSASISSDISKNEPSTSSQAPSTPSQALSVPSQALSTSLLAPNKSEDGYKVVCEGGICKKVKVDDDVPEVATSSESQTDAKKSQLSVEEKVERAKELLEIKRQEKLEEEKKLEKQKELDRRTQGHGLVELKKWQQEQELKNLKEERRKEKMENDKARARILEQIAQDRAERLQQDKPQSTEAPAKPVPTTQHTSSSDYTVTKIQFRMADGSTHTTQVEPTSTLADLRQYVRSNVQTSGTFTLSTMYPKQFLNEDKDHETMQSLGLHPSCVLLLLRGSASTSNTRGPSSAVADSDGLFGMASQFFWSFVYRPVYGVWFWLSSFFGGNTSSASTSQPTQDQSSAEDPSRVRRFPSDNDRAANSNGESRGPSAAINKFHKKTSGHLGFFVMNPYTFQHSGGIIDNEAKRRKVNPSNRGGTTSIRREGNTYRLKDNDSDDENNTWNGNSTQQM